ncbi:hypothetical protein [Mycetohabitans endofungorum]|uniref:hypothetical protein n=1 Tax=Mycetohabitans endofungorum TaxID=417203 RepID=UPI0030CF77EA
MYISSGDYDEAPKLYEAAHGRKPDDVELVPAAAGTAVSAKQYSYANNVIASALQPVVPNNPCVLAQADASIALRDAMRRRLIIPAQRSRLKSCLQAGATDRSACA